MSLPDLRSHLSALSIAQKTAGRPVVLDSRQFSADRRSSIRLRDLPGKHLSCEQGPVRPDDVQISHSRGALSFPVVGQIEGQRYPGGERRPPPVVFRPWAGRTRIKTRDKMRRETAKISGLPSRWLDAVKCFFGKCRAAASSGSLMPDRGQAIHKHRPFIRWITPQAIFVPEPPDG